MDIDYVFGIFRIALPNKVNGDEIEPYGERYIALVPVNRLKREQHFVSDTLFDLREQMLDTVSVNWVEAEKHLAKHCMYKPKVDAVNRILS